MDPVLKRVLDEIVKDAKSSPGSVAGNTIRRLGDIYSKYFPFESVLRKILEREKYDFSRPNRRVMIEGSFVPRRKIPKFKVYAAIDVSGSCFNYSEQFLAYIKSLPEFEEVDFFDTGIRHTMKKGDSMPSGLNGYGGTDANPVMCKWEKLESRNITTNQLNFILLTDGEIPRLQFSPKKSNVIVFTTNEEVHARSGKRWMNIHI
jgi:predicted metal-dependent peptidase